MSEFLFKFCFDSGRISYISAGSRKEAIEIFSKENGMSEEWKKKHCVIKKTTRYLEMLYDTLLV